MPSSLPAGGVLVPVAAGVEQTQNIKSGCFFRLYFVVNRFCLLSDRVWVVTLKHFH